MKIPRLHFDGEGKKMVKLCSKYLTMTKFKDKISPKGLWVAVDGWMSEGGLLFTKLMSAFPILRAKNILSVLH